MPLMNKDEDEEEEEEKEDKEELMMTLDHIFYINSVYEFIVNFHIPY